MNDQEKLDQAFEEYLEIHEVDVWQREASREAFDAGVAAGLNLSCGLIEETLDKFDSALGKIETTLEIDEDDLP